MDAPQTPIHKFNPTKFQDFKNIGLLSHKTHPKWIFDCGATNSMTFDPRDLLSIQIISRTHIQSSNGECIPVDQEGPIDISPSLCIKNCLLIPSLSHKLLFISQLTKELNFTVLKTSDGCVIQDAQR